MIRRDDMRAGVQLAGYPYDSKEMPPMVKTTSWIIPYNLYSRIKTNVESYQEALIASIED